MGAPGFPLSRVGGRGKSVYRGDCHVHSVYSDGELTPEQLTAGARAAGLDFIATTEHNAAEAHGAWRAPAGDDLLVILGEEVTTETGHWLALGIRPGQLVDWRYRVRDEKVGQNIDRVHQVGGLCVAAHPHAPYPESADVDLAFTVSTEDGSAGIGELLKAGGDLATVHVDVRGVPAGAVTLHTDTGAAHRANLPGTGSGSIDWCTSAGESQFVRVEVRHPDGRMAALSNPIILDGTRHRLDDLFQATRASRMIMGRSRKTSDSGCATQVRTAPMAETTHQTAQKERWLISKLG